ncbi:MAG: ExbD/TolR family protein [Phycisphaerae bacterium]|jgi:biopolymer transport protein ExbD
MNLSKGRSRRISIEAMRLPLVALIDVVLFLLFYFMVAGDIASSEAELQTTLATQQGAGANASSLQTQIVDVKMDNGVPVYRVGARTVRTSSTLTNILGNLPRDMGVIIRVDDNVPVEAAAIAVQAATDAGFTKITYTPGS